MTPSVPEACNDDCRGGGAAGGRCPSAFDGGGDHEQPRDRSPPGMHHLLVGAIVVYFLVLSSIIYIYIHLTRSCIYSYAPAAGGHHLALFLSIVMYSIWTFDEIVHQHVSSSCWWVPSWYTCLELSTMNLYKIGYLQVGSTCWTTPSWYSYMCLEEDTLNNHEIENLYESSSCL